MPLTPEETRERARVRMNAKRAGLKEQHRLEREARIDVSASRKAPLPRVEGSETIEGYTKAKSGRVKKRSKLLPVTPSIVLDTPANTEVLGVGPVTYRPAGAGRPSLLTEDIIRRMALLVASGITLFVACAAMGISRGAHDNWVAQGKADLAAGHNTIQAQFWEAMLEAKGACEANWVARLNEGTAVDWRAAAFMLERRFPDRWAVRKEEPKKDESALTAGKSTAELQKLLGQMQAGLAAEAAAGAPMLVASTSRDAGDEDA